ncbi:nucleoside-diphosphate kinase [Candidatus Babeliales bacterium]|nr:nucleoside-diphosphate kinase [Candidatus Babeliales bacterium]
MTIHKTAVLITAFAVLCIIPGCSWFFSTPQPVNETTLAIIKPDAVRARNTGKIIDSIEHHDFTIVRMKKVQLTPGQAEKFYAVHKEKPFFANLIEFMTSGPIIVLALEKENAIEEWRKLMGSTNPAKSAPGTIRRLFGTSVSENAVHGSDSSENAKIELALFFPDL